MDAGNALFKMLTADHVILDPGDGNALVVDRDRFYFALKPAGTETHILRAPIKPGIVGHIGCREAQTVTVTVQQVDTTTNIKSTTGTITFTAAGQWIGLISVELSAGVYAWQATDVYGCTTTIQTAQNWSAAVANATMTNLNVSTGATILAASIGSVTVGASNITALTGVFKSINVSTGMTAPLGTINQLVATSKIEANSILATNLSVGTGLTAPSILCSSNLSVASVLATNVSIGTGLTAGTILGTNITLASKAVLGGAVQVSGGIGVASSDASVLNSPVQMVSVGTSTKNYWKLPAAAVGLCVNVVNVGGSSAGLVGFNATESINGATSALLATKGAASAAWPLVCDGTHWWRRDN